MSIKLNGIEKMNPRQRLSYALRLLEGQIETEKDALARLANASAILMALVEELNWVGFYLRRGESLVLGPFQGRPACTRIALGEGVCGKAAASKKTLRVDDVLSFPGHIACDEASRSELVVPLLDSCGEVWGVLDVDSPRPERFGEMEQEKIQAFAQKLSQAIDPQFL